MSRIDSIISGPELAEWEAFMDASAEFSPREDTQADGMIRLTLKLRAATLAKAHTATGEEMPDAWGKAKSFSAGTAPARHQQDQHDWEPKLTPLERHSLKQYTDKHHAGPALNAYHRAGKLAPGDHSTPKIAAGMDSALAKTKITEPGGIVVHRGIGGAFAKSLVDKHDAGERLEGGSYTEKGYLSTSLLPHVAHKFMNDTADLEHCVTIHHMIEVHPGVHMGSVEHLTQAPGENEMLGERGLTMHHLAFTEHDPLPETVKRVRDYAAATGRTMGTGPGQVPPPRHFILHSEIRPIGEDSAPAAPKAPKMQAGGTP